MRIGVNRLHFPVTSLGPGRRLGIWLQGCNIGCPGCLSRDTWLPDERFFLGVGTVVDWCRQQMDLAPDGVTISGGEPFEQPEALASLLDGLTVLRSEAASPMDFLCYSGLPLARLKRDFAAILDRLDAVISEPFVANMPTTRPWRGSANQKLVPLSAHGHERYAPFSSTASEHLASFQVHVQSGRIWFTGIPRRGDLEKLEAACASRGIVMKDVSWRA
jgi:anaerobic ribonucleoside-triphosphate reductase activating protein